MLKAAFEITNKTDHTFVVTSSIPEARGPSVSEIKAGEKAIWFKQPSMTSITIEVK